MLSSFVIVLAILVGVTAGDYDCETLRSACRSIERGLPDSFPETTEELDEACSDYIYFLECGIAVETKCPSAGRSLEIAREILVTVNDVCQEHGVLRSGIANNIGCLKEFFEAPTPPEECFQGPPDEEKIEAYIKVLTDAGEIDSDDELTTRMCLIQLNSAACVLLKLEEKCGQDAMDAVVEILRRHAPDAIHNCGEEISKHLATIVRLYKSMEESEEIADILSRK